MIGITAILIIILIFVLAALPLHFAVKIMGGKTTILKTILINIIAGLVLALITSAAPIFGGILGFLGLLFTYMFFFRIGFLRALVVWLLQIVLVGIFWVLGIIIGVTALAGAILL